MEKGKALIKKSIFSVNCEMNEITQLITFFRSFNFVWKTLKEHKICDQKLSGENCFFCHMRSSCLRLNASRGRGPKGLKISEFSSELDQYQSLLGWNWRHDVQNLPTLVKSTLKLLNIHDYKYGKKNIRSKLFWTCQQKDSHIGILCSIAFTLDSPMSQNMFNKEDQILLHYASFFFLAYVACYTVL